VTRGKVVRGYLGVSIQALTSALAKSLQLNTTEGVLVSDVSPGSPAAKASVKRGDVILSFNDRPVHEPGQLRNLVAMTAPGTQARLQILRENHQREVSVELGELPHERTAAREGEETPAPAQLGFSVQNMTPTLAKHLGTERSEGVVVTEVDPNSEAYEAGVRRGMVIYEVNKHEVKNTQEFRQAMEQAEQSKRILLLGQIQDATMYITFPVG